MKKIMFYINAIHNGGAERVMVNLSKYFSLNNYDTVLVTSFRDTWEYSLSADVKRITLEEEEIKQSRIKRNISRIKKLRQVCKDEKPDILISFMEEPNFRAIIATRGLSIKTLVSVRNDPYKEYAGKVGKIVGKIILPMADGCVFQTSEAKEWFPKKLQNKSKIIYNAVKEEFYQIDRKPNRGEIVTCGRLEEQKNHANLINAFSEIIKDYPYTSLKIYGEGSLKKELQKQIDSLGLEKKAFLMGQTNDVANVLQTADLFVLSSNYEGMPNALMEAMAAGVSCISTDCPCGGPRELLKEIEDKALVPVDDVSALAEKIKDYMGTVGEQNFKMKMIAEKFKPDIINEQWKKYVDELIQE